MNNFPVAIESVLRREGGYVNNPDDKGGETNWGISKKYHQNVDIKNLTREDAKLIYYGDYWLKNSLDKIAEQKVATATLDTVANHGSGARLIQQAINRAGGRVSVDGKIGTGTISVLNKLDPAKFLAALYVEREYKYRDLVSKDPTQTQFLKGWLARISKYKGAAEGGIVALEGGIVPLLAVGLIAYFYMKKS